MNRGVDTARAEFMEGVDTQFAERTVAVDTTKGVTMTTVKSVKNFIKNRRFQRHTREALIHLARDPDASYRQVGRAHGIDPGRLYKTAALVPGLTALRTHRRNVRAA